MEEVEGKGWAERELYGLVLMMFFNHILRDLHHRSDRFKLLPSCSYLIPDGA